MTPIDWTGSGLVLGALVLAYVLALAIDFAGRWLANRRGQRG